MRTLLLTAVLALTFPAWADQVRLQENAPDHHVVVKGDTLWGISETFLKDPWLWPEVWRLNRDEIRNPHLIYPGDVVRLGRDGDGNVRLTLEKGPRLEETVEPHAGFVGGHHDNLDACCQGWRFVRSRILTCAPPILGIP